MNTSWIEHPGFYIKEEMEARGWRQVDLAFILGISENAVNEILKGKRGISPDMAKALGEAFDVSPEFFANLQKSYELSKAQDPNPAVALRGQLQSKYPIREMVRRGWLENTDAILLQAQLIRFFNVNSLDEVPYMKYAAYKTKYEEKDIPAEEVAWLYRVHQIAKSISVPKFTEKALRFGISDLEGLLNSPDDVRFVPQILMECGVRFIIVEKLPKGKIDGVCFWLDDESPVIGMSTRRDKIDNFWFVLRHEIEHVLRGDGKNAEVLDIELEKEKTSSTDTSLPEEERIANAAAADFCVPTHKLDSFMERKRPYYYETDVEAFARLRKRHSGLVVGQMQFRLGDYKYLYRHLVPVRKFILPTTNHDGFDAIFPISL